MPAVKGWKKCLFRAKKRNSIIDLFMVRKTSMIQKHCFRPSCGPHPIGWETLFLKGMIKKCLFREKRRNSIVDLFTVPKGSTIKNHCSRPSFGPHPIGWEPLFLKGTIKMVCFDTKKEKFNCTLFEVRWMAIIIEMALVGIDRSIECKKRNSSKVIWTWANSSCFCLVNWEKQKEMLSDLN